MDLHHALGHDHLSMSIDAHDDFQCHQRLSTPVAETGKPRRHQTS
jgi:hypothetical protein